MVSGDKPRVYVVGTGGSISFLGDYRTDYVNYSYGNKHLTIQQMLDRVPETNEFAEVVAEQLINVGSTDVGPEHWLQLARRYELIRWARTVLSHAKDLPANVLSGSVSLDKAYKDACDRRDKATGEDLQLSILRKHYPELADKVVDGELGPLRSPHSAVSPSGVVGGVIRPEIAPGGRCAAPGRANA